MSRFKQDAAAQNALSQTVKLAAVKSEDYVRYGLLCGRAQSNVGSCRKPGFHRSARVFLQFREADRSGLSFSRRPSSRVVYQGVPLVKGKRVTGFTRRKR